MENYDLRQIHHFNELHLKSDLLRAISSYGYQNPSDVQKEAILPILQGFDVIIKAQSGTGKSASFIIPLLQSIDEDLEECQAIILAPSEELAKGLSNLMKRIVAKFLKISILACDKSVSGGDIEGIQILIGTPEIILNLLKIGALKMNALKILVVDEADRLVLQEETREILEEIDGSIQVIVTSLTMSDNILAIANKYTKNPVRIWTKQEKSLLSGNHHFYILVDEKESKSDSLIELLQEGVGKAAQALIFCNDKESVKEVSNALLRKNFTCSKIDETKEFVDRDKAIKKFQKEQIKFLVTTDILLKGVDIKQISFVFNYDFPLTKEGYLHRLQTCFRLNNGKVINFVKPNEAQRLKELRISYGINFNCFPDGFF